MRIHYLLLLTGILLTTGCSDDDGGDAEVITYVASITSPTTTIGENGGSASFTVELDNTNQGDAISFDLSFTGSATLDQDYSVSSESRTIANGSSSTSFTLTSTDDSDVEGDEVITVTLSFASNTNVTVGNNGILSFNLTDDDSDSNQATFTASITSPTTTIDENGGSASFTVELDNTNQGDAISFDLSFTGSATLDQDYSVSSESRTIANGSASTSFTLTSTDDSDAEGNEGITITLAFASNTNVTVGDNSVLSFTITDDDTNTGSCSGTMDSYLIDLDASGCRESAEEDLGVSSEFIVSVSGSSRTIESNGIPDHKIGMFPNMGNPNSISVQDKTFTITTNPTMNSEVTSLTGDNGRPRYWFGILDNSVILAPIANEFFTNTSTGEDNIDWNENALSSNISLGTDCNNSHVFPTGRYHHHATPSAYVADRNISNSMTTQIGWAADGYPIYYKYGNKESSIVELASSYQLKTTERGGDDITAPSGCPDGTYTQDYEYIEGLGDLDECNGYEDPVLGYIYVITDTYPSIPRCFVGTPSEDFLNN